MKTIKPQRLGLLTKTYEFEGKFYLAVNVMAYFAFEQPKRLLSEVSLWKFAATALGKDAILDMGMPKQHGEFLAFGNCYSPTGLPVTAALAKVKVGSQEKVLLVTGNRHWRKRGLLASISEPEPFKEMALSYANAFGGAGFANNPTGKGVMPEDASMPHGLPNVENPQNLVVFQEDKPQPAGFAPLDFVWPQRFSKAGTYDQKWLKTRFPGYAADMDWTIFNTAPVDQWLPGFFRGDEAFEIAGMHAQKPLVSSSLPGCQARCFVTHVRDTSLALREVNMRAETLLLFPNAERGIVMFRGVTEISTDDACDVAHLVVAAETLGAAKSLAHYQEILHRRLDKKYAAVHSLIDEPLLPDMPPALGSVDADVVEKLVTWVTPKGLLHANLKNRMHSELANSKLKIQTLRDELIATNKKFGLPTPDLTDIDRALAVTIAPEEAPPTLEELPVFKEKMEKLMQSMKVEALQKKTQAIAQLRAVCDAQKIDYDEVMAAAKRESGGPPKPAAEKLMAQLQQVQREVQAAKVEQPEFDKKLADQTLHQKLVAADAQILALYKKSAHLFPDAPVLLGEDAAKGKANLVAAFADNKKFIGQDLTGADFSNLKLSGIDFTDALLDGADFSGTDLSAAVFSNAVLARVNFKGANLRQANFSNANLGFANLSGVNAAGAQFTNANLAGVDASNVNFSQAVLMGCDLMGAKLEGADFSGAQACEVKFLQVDLKATEITPEMMEGLPPFHMARTKFVGADLKKAMFLECQLDGVDFSNAQLDKALFLSPVGKGVNFSGASLKNVCVVKLGKLPQANFVHANLANSNWRGTDLSAAQFTQANLEQADLSECVLPSANFKQAKASGLQLVKADVSGADFSSANLMGANLQKANLCGTIFSGTNLFMADLLRVRRDAKTVFLQTNLKKTLLHGAFE